MLRPPFASTPATLPAFLLVYALFLPGCSSAPPQKPQTDASAATSTEATSTTAQRDAFTLEIQARKEIADFLSSNLEIQRFRQLEDLSASELSRLLGSADADARELLGTLGYFAPTLKLEMRETPENAKAKRAVTIIVEPGKQTHIRGVGIQFSGPIETDPAFASQRASITTQWGLRPGQAFTQSAWDSAKTTGLRALNNRRFPTGSIAQSLADIDADTAEAQLSVTYESGPAFRLGPIQVNGNQRYSADAVRLLARLPTGAEYDATTLQDAQQRLTRSGYYDSAFLSLDTEAPDPQAAPVTAQVHEAQLQRMVFGVGVSTDSGARVSVDHTHNRMPTDGWRAVSRIAHDRDTSTLGTELTSLPNESGWRWVTSGLLQREPAGSFEITSTRLRLGRTQEGGDRIDRSHILQLDDAHSRGGVDTPALASALSFNWSWTGRYFDNPLSPTDGMGLALEVGPGVTLTGEHRPFGRAYARWLNLTPMGSTRADDGSVRKNHLVLRAEAGALVAKDSARIPATLMFLTGGDTTVRGYSYQQIGARTENGETFAGRYMLAGSIEYQRPFIYKGEMSDMDAAVFIDAGAVADKPGDLQAKVGAGVGGRWRSPIGPIQLDLAYGFDVKRLRLHLRLGFSF